MITKACTSTIIQRHNLSNYIGVKFLNWVWHWLSVVFHYSSVLRTVRQITVSGDSLTVSLLYECCLSQQLESHICSLMPRNILWPWFESRKKTFLFYVRNAVVIRSEMSCRDLHLIDNWDEDNFCNIWIMRPLSIWKKTVGFWGMIGSSLERWYCSC